MTDVVTRTAEVREMSAAEVDEHFYLYPGVRGILATVGGDEVGHLMWSSITHVIEEVQVEPRWRFKGIAAQMLAEARGLDPEVKHSTTLTDDGAAWSQHVGGPASDTVPLGRFPVEAPERDDFGPNDVVIFKPAAKDIEALPVASRRLVEAAIERLRNGTARALMEPKEREPLLGTYTLRVTNSLRVGFYLSGEKDDWHVYWVGEHNYVEAERRFWNSPGYVRFAAPQHQTFRRAAGLNGDLPEGLAIEETRSGLVGAERAVVATVDGLPIGRLTWATSGAVTGEVMDIVVQRAYRRRGIASAMWAKAKELDPTVHHSTSQTYDGEAWAEKVAGLNGDLPEGLTLRVTPDWAMDSRYRGLTAHLGAARIGTLTWSVATGEIDEVSVSSDYRRMGVASAMLAAARAVDPRVHHSDLLSPDGTAWAEKVASAAKIYRGFGVLFASTEDLRAFQQQSTAEQAETLGEMILSRRYEPHSGGVQRHGLGRHWSTEEWVATGWANTRSGFNPLVLPVVVEAERPGPQFVETDPELLENRGVGQYGDEAEVTIKPGTTMRVVGLRWKTHAGHDDYVTQPVSMTRTAAEFEESEHPRAADGKFTRKGENFTREQQDAFIREQFGPSVKGDATMKHPKSGYDLPVGKRRSVLQPEDGVEGPPLFKVKDYGENLDDPKQRYGMGTDAGTEPIEYVYRGMSKAEYEQAQERGYFASDGRSTITDWEGTNAAVDPETAAYYLATTRHSDGGGYLVRFKVHPDRKWFTIRADSYLRTRENIPLEDIDKAVPLGVDFSGSSLYPVTGGLHTASAKTYKVYRGIALGYPYQQPYTDSRVLSEINFARSTSGDLGYNWTSDEMVAIGFATKSARTCYYWFAGVRPEQDYYGVVMEATITEPPVPARGGFDMPGEEAVAPPYPAVMTSLVAHLYLLPKGTEWCEPEAARLVRTIPISLSRFKTSGLEEDAVEQWRTNNLVKHDGEPGHPAVDHFGTPVRPKPLFVVAPSGRRTKVEVETYHDGMSSSVEAYIYDANGRERIGELSWLDGTIDEVRVEDEYQRQGVASHLLAYARWVEPGLRHSTNLTDEGRAWSQHVGAAKPGLEEFRFSKGPVAFAPRNQPQWQIQAITEDEDGRRVVAGHIRWLSRDITTGKSKGAKAGEVVFVFVRPEYQRRGLATELWNKAKRLDPRVHHSTVQTEDGKAWAPHAAGRVGSADGYMHLWHTTTPEYAQRLSQQGTAGVKPVGRNTTGTDYEPGRGMGKGLYLSRHPDPTFGTVALSVKVREDELMVPPERAHRIPAGMTPIRSLNVGDGYTEVRLGPERFGPPREVTYDNLGTFTDERRVGSRHTAASLPSGLFWRCQERGVPFGAEHATSRPWGTDPGHELERRGYSCMTGPWELWGYWANSRAQWVLDDEVIAFSGEQTGNIGFEGLAVPDMREVHRMSWAEFEQRLVNTPAPAAVNLNTSVGSWRGLAQMMLAQNPGSVAAQMLLSQTTASRHTAASVVVEPPSNLDYGPSGYHVTERIALHEGSGYHEDADVAKGHAKREKAYQNWRSENPRRKRPERYNPGTPWIPAGYTYFTEENSTPGTVAFIDLDVHGDAVAIAYAAVRPDFRGKGLARRLIEETYKRHPHAKIHWGKIMQPEMGHLYEQFKASHPEQTGGMQRYWGSLHTAAAATRWRGKTVLIPGPVEGRTPEQWRDAALAAFSGRHEGLGQHWSRNQDVARRFAEMKPGQIYVSPKGTHLPVVIEAEVDPMHFDNDAQYDAGGMFGGEAEDYITPGAPISVRAVWLRLPGEAQRTTPAGDIVHTAGEWIRVDTPMTATAGTKDWVDMLAEMRRGNGAAKDGYKYHSFDDLISQQGKHYPKVATEAQFKAKGYERGPMKVCFQNAATLAFAHPELTYVEGYADMGLMAMNHAWCVDADGLVYDPTWKPGQGRDYFGVPVPTNFLRSHVLKSGIWGLFAGEPGKRGTNNSLLKAGIPKTGSRHTAAFTRPDGLMILEKPDGLIAIRPGTEPQGQITWTVEQDERAFSDDDDVWPNAMGDHNGYYLRIDHLHVEPQFRHQGVGTALLEEFIKMAEKHYGKKGWDPGSFTADGAAFWKAVRHEDVPVTQRMHYGSVKDLPEGYVMEVHEQEKYGHPAMTILVKHDGKPVAALGVHQSPDPRPHTTTNVAYVSAVQVYPEHQRKGIATAMYAEMHKRWPGVPVWHSPGQAQSPDARALNQTLKEEFGPTMHIGFRLTAEEEWQTGHQPNGPDDDYGSALWELDRGTYPPDVYTRPRLYDNGEPGFEEAVRTIMAARGKPDAMVTIYRSMPAAFAKDPLPRGSWVGISLAYCKQHGTQIEEADDWPVMRYRVAAKDVWSPGDSLQEYGYWGPPVHGEVVFHGGTNQHISKAASGDLTFTYAETQTGGSKWPVKGSLEAHRGSDGLVGVLDFFTPKRKGGPILIDSLFVYLPYRRQGIAGALMDEMQRRFPGSAIDHGDRTDDGKAWWSGYTEDHSVTRGRTMAANRVDYKPERPLTGTGAVPLATFLPRAQFHPFEDAPFMAALDAAMGTHPGDPDYLAKRRAFFAHVPVTTVRLDAPLTITQPNVNVARVNEIAEFPERGGSESMWMVLHDGRYWVLNGHHRLAADWARGDEGIEAKVVDTSALRKAAGANGGLPEGLVFKDVDATTDEGYAVRIVRAWLGTKAIGYLMWNVDDDYANYSYGEILDIRVDDRYQRRGVASALLKRARELDPEVRHSNVVTDDGAEFAIATGSKTASGSDLLGDLSGLSEESVAEIKRQIALIPSSDLAVLRSYGVTVVAVDKASSTDYARAQDYGAVYDFRVKQVQLSRRRSGLNDLRGNGLTVLHELGHAMDYAKGRPSQWPIYARIQKSGKPTMNYFKGKGRGAEEIFAESWAATHGGYTPSGFTLSEDLREIAEGAHGIPTTAALRTEAISAVPDGLTFRRATGEYDDQSDGVKAYINGEDIGEIHWQTVHISGEGWSPDVEVGEVGWIYVDPPWRRKGIATALWHKAKEIEPRLHHSHVQTADGKGWGQMVATLKTANMAYYANEWRQQDRLGKSHELNLDRTGPQLRAYAKRVFKDAGCEVEFTLDLTRGVGWSDSEVIDGKAVLHIDGLTPGIKSQRNFWTVLHECAHVIAEVRDGMDHWDVNHGPGFVRVFQSLLDTHGASQAKIGSKTASAVTLKVMHNPVKAPKTDGYGQDIEPAGRYLTEATEGSRPPAGWDVGEVTFANPLRIPWGDGYDAANSWKRVLHQRYGLTGQALSAALRADGYDAIITFDKYGTSEIVDLRGISATGAREGVDGHWDRSGDEPVWVQPHASLVRDALWSWKGDPASMETHLALEMKGAPQPDSGSGKMMRAQAAALLKELRENGKPNPKALYRGGARDLAHLTEWSEKKSVAKVFGRGNDSIRVLAPGQANGLRIADHIDSQLDALEKGWVVLDAPDTGVLRLSEAAIDPERQGLCYPNAYNYLMDQDDFDAVLVHGRIVGDKSHAWVESRGTVYDPTLDEIFPAADYYRDAQAVAEQRYTIDEAQTVSDTHGTYGPWNGRRTAAWKPFVAPAGIKVTSGGDAVPGGYNGYFVAWDEATGEKMGYLDYHSAGRDEPVLIAMVEVDPKYRRKGIATMLVAALRNDFEGYLISPGYTTADGGAWWAKAQHTAGMKGDLPEGLRLEPSTGWHAEWRTSLTAFCDPDESPYFGGRCGTIEWNTDTGEVENIAVPEKMQRRGIATWMFREAKATVEPRLHHSPVRNQTDDGRPWVRHETTAGLNGDLPAGLETVFVDPPASMGEGWTICRAVLDGTVVGELIVTPEGTISWINVFEDHMQRRGIATEMLKAVRKIRPVEHGELNAHSRPWAERVGSQGSLEVRYTGAMSRSAGETLIERLRAMGLPIPEGAKVQRTNASRSGRAEGAWTWRIVDAEGWPFLSPGEGYADLMIGSPEPVSALVKEPRLAASPGRFSRSEVDVYGWYEAAAHPHRWTEAETKTAAATVTTVRKDSTDRVTGERKRGLTHEVFDAALGMTWCGQKPSGVTVRKAAADPATVDCEACAKAKASGNPTPYRRR